MKKINSSVLMLVVSMSLTFGQVCMVFSQEPVVVVPANTAPAPQPPVVVTPAKVTTKAEAKSSFLAGVSVETLGAVKYKGIDDGPTYGVGLALGYDFNKYVKGYVRALTYETDNWRGSAVDEGGLGVEARLFQSANNRITFSALGGVIRDFSSESWGLGLGGKLRAVIYKSVYGFGQAEYQVVNKEPHSILAAVGLGLSL